MNKNEIEICEFEMHLNNFLFVLKRECFLSEISGEERFWTSLVEENGVFRHS